MNTQLIEKNNELYRKTRQRKPKDNEHIRRTWKTYQLICENLYKSVTNLCYNQKPNITEKIIRNRIIRANLYKSVKNLCYKWHADYTPYGEILTEDFLLTWLPLKTFALHEYDKTTGLYYMQARWFDPVTAQFTSEDPAMDGLNWYAYAGGNPLGGIDPTGLYDPDEEEAKKAKAEADRIKEELEKALEAMEEKYNGEADADKKLAENVEDIAKGINIPDDVDIIYLSQNNAVGIDDHVGALIKDSEDIWYYISKDGLNTNGNVNYQYADKISDLYKQGGNDVNKFLNEFKKGEKYTDLMLFDNIDPKARDKMIDKAELIKDKQYEFCSFGNGNYNSENCSDLLYQVFNEGGINIEAPKKTIGFEYSVPEIQWDLDAFMMPKPVIQYHKEYFTIVGGSSPDYQFKQLQKDYPNNKVITRK